MIYLDSKFAVEPTGGLQYDEHSIANFLPEIRGAFWRPGSRHPEAPATIRLRMNIVGEEAKPERYLTFNELMRLDFETVFPGCQCIDEETGRSTLKLVRQFLKKRIRTIGQSNLCGVLYEETGWYWDPRGSRFIAGSEVLGEDPAPHAFCDTVRSLRLAATDQTADAKAAENLLLLLQRQPDVMLPIYSFTLFGALRSIFRDERIPTACVLNVQGKQGFGKTTIVKRLCTLYDDNTGHIADVFDAASTKAAMRDALAEARDRIVLDDDICKSSDARIQKERKRNAAELLRIAANDTPFVRKVGRKNVNAECQASLVITGEIPFEAESDITRCVTVELTTPLTGGSDNDRHVAATALLSYLCWFAAHAEDERYRLRKDFEEFKNRNRSDGEERLQTSLWELSWVFNSFLRFAGDVGAISERAGKQVDAVLTKILQGIFASTKQRLNLLHRQSMDDIEVIIRTGVQMQRVKSIEHNGCICFRLEDLTRYLQAYSGREDLSTCDVAATLRLHNMLRMDASSKSTCKVRGKRMVCIPKNRLFEKNGW